MSLPPIVSPELLSSLLSDPALVLLDARPGADAYAAGHLIGARHADLNVDLSAASDPGFDPRHGGRHPLPPLARFTALLGQWGITPQSKVVIYDAADASNAAARAWWMLRAVGHENVSVVDGGFAALSSFPMTTDRPPIASAPPYPATSWQLPTFDIGQIDELRRDANWKVLDVRSTPRFEGLTEPFDPIAGHIPGAMNLPYAENMRDGRFKSPAELRTQYQELLGDTPVDHLVVHCGSGVTACHTLLALEHAGLRGAALYVGSWSEWCRSGKPQAK